MTKTPPPFARPWSTIRLGRCWRSTSTARWRTSSTTRRRRTRTSTRSRLSADSAACSVRWRSSPDARSRRRLSSAASSGVAGLDRLIILGQYGAERWSATDGEPAPVERPEAIAQACGAAARLARRARRRSRTAGGQRSRAGDPHPRHRPRTCSRRSPIRWLSWPPSSVSPSSRVVRSSSCESPGMDKGQALRSLVARCRSAAGDLRRRRPRRPAGVRRGRRAASSPASTGC